MNKRTNALVWIAMIGLLAVAWWGAGSAPGQVAEPAPDQPAGDDALHQRALLSYGVGFHLGTEVREGLRMDDVDADLELLVKAFSDGLNGVAPAMDPDELDRVLEAVHREMQNRLVKRLLAENPAFRELHDRNLERSQAFHEGHRDKPGVITLPDGVQYEVLRAGTGASPGPHDIVVATFRGTLLDGTEFTAGDRKELDLDTVKATGARVLQMMKVGDHWSVAVPPDQGYGAAGDPPLVGPNETLLFDVELLEVKQDD